VILLYWNFCSELFTYKYKQPTNALQSLKVCRLNQICHQTVHISEEKLKLTFTDLSGYPIHLMYFVLSVNELDPIAYTQRNRDSCTHFEFCCFIKAVQRCCKAAK